MALDSNQTGFTATEAFSAVEGQYAPVEVVSLQRLYRAIQNNPVRATLVLSEMFGDNDAVNGLAETIFQP